jgi:hypothetical protein
MYRLRVLRGKGKPERKGAKVETDSKNKKKKK